MAKKKKAKVEPKIDLSGSGIRIGETGEESDSAMDMLVMFGMTDPVSYFVDIGADVSNTILVTDVPPAETKRLYAEGKRRNPKHFRASMAYSCAKTDTDLKKISFNDFVAGKDV